ELFIAPGNPGTGTVGQNIALNTGDFQAVATFCREKKVDMVVVGPEDPLVNGIYDFLKQDAELPGLIVVGPSAAGAQLEGSKAFAKAFMARHGIPTASYREFNRSNYNEGIQYLQQHKLPVVLKADGLAAGKGVVIAQTHEEALVTFEEMIQQSKFGSASEKVVVEEFLDGIEMSAFALTDGSSYVMLPEAKDYKRIGEGDTGPNTGGMGAISPVPFYNGDFRQKVIDKVVRPTIEGLSAEKIVYKGFVFFGLINVAGEPYVIEYNCRMGDPETEVVMPRLQSDLVQLFLDMSAGELGKTPVLMDERTATTVVLVSGGYPGDFERGKTISGMANLSGTDLMVFQAGIKEANGHLFTNGGRVAAVTSMGDSVQDAVAGALKSIDSISFEGMNFRKDIGYEFMN
ncbi:MAG: phosphoribosylamine--glycine ligase, partial [Bacteroidota bacterium]